MRFDYYHPFTDKEGNIKPGIKPQVKSWADILLVVHAQGFGQRLGPLLRFRRRPHGRRRPLRRPIRPLGPRLRFRAQVRNLRTSKSLFSLFGPPARQTEPKKAAKRLEF